MNANIILCSCGLILNIVFGGISTEEQELMRSSGSTEKVALADEMSSTTRFPETTIFGVTGEALPSSSTDYFNPFLISSSNSPKTTDTFSDFQTSTEDQDTISSTEDQDTISSTVEEDTITSTDVQDASVCYTNPTLEAYCSPILTPEEFVFFQNDTSLNGILSKIINSSVVSALHRYECPPGTWCLPDSFYKEIFAGKEDFYETPICRSDVLWDCLKIIQQYTKGCDQNELYFLMSSIALLCDMEVIENGRISSHCYARTVGTLDVLYSDMTRGLKAENLNSTDECIDYNKRFLNTYECARKSCNVDQQAFLQDFGPWSFITSKHMSMIENCNLTLACQMINPDLNDEDTMSRTISATTLDPSQALENALDDQTEFEQTKLNKKIEELNAIMAEEAFVDELTNGGNDNYQTSTPDFNKDNFDQDSTEFDNENSMDTPSDNIEDDQAFIYGMVTVTILVTIGLSLIGIISLRRWRNRYYKKGYSQMSDEECRMLRGDYN